MVLIQLNKIGLLELANIFMHHAFDEWMKRNFPKVKFERFADDIVTHCISHKQAEEMLEEIKIRLSVVVKT